MFYYLLIFNKYCLCPSFVSFILFNSLDAWIWNTRSCHVLLECVRSLLWSLLFIRVITSCPKLIYKFFLLFFFFLNICYVHIRTWFHCKVLESTAFCLLGTVPFDWTFSERIKQNLNMTFLLNSPTTVHSLEKGWTLNKGE